MTIVNTGENLKIEESAVRLMLERRVEGIIYAAMYHRAVEPPTDVREAPTVLLNCFAEDGTWTSVVPDEVSGVVQLLRSSWVKDMKGWAS